MSPRPSMFPHLSITAALGGHCRRDLTAHAAAATVAVALVLSTVTSCGSHATSSPPPSPVNTTSTFSPPSATNAAPSLTSLEKTFACGANSVDMGPGNGAIDEVQCFLPVGGWQHGETLDLATFTSPANEHSWANITTHIAGNSSCFVVTGPLDGASVESNMYSGCAKLAPHVAQVIHGKVYSLNGPSELAS
jgi:hypothetical protein